MGCQVLHTRQIFEMSSGEQFANISSRISAGRVLIAEDMVVRVQVASAYLPLSTVLNIVVKECDQCLDVCSLAKSWISSLPYPHLLRRNQHHSVRRGLGNIFPSVSRLRGPLSVPPATQREREIGWCELDYRNGRVD